MVLSRVKLVPRTRGHFSRLVQEIRKPVAVPTEAATSWGIMRRMPDSVALVRRTAWKYSGLSVFEVSHVTPLIRASVEVGTYALNKIALRRNEPRKLENMIFARGGLCRRLRGMIGRSAFDSAQRQDGKPTRKMARETMIRGCDQGSTFPPRLYRDVLLVSVGNISWERKLK